MAGCKSKWNYNASINPASLALANNLYTWDVCLSSTDCYDFTITDSYMEMVYVVLGAMVHIL
ncbi:MAG: hypothetical protein CM15mP112_07320 [Flavobacteriales bacterium]|nr:MAG: hypothetical protein CM15mP112_07320 [Flavobacteriales bacterium]